MPTIPYFGYLTMVIIHIAILKSGFVERNTELWKTYIQRVKLFISIIKYLDSTGLNKHNVIKKWKTVNVDGLLGYLNQILFVAV